MSRKREELIEKYAAEVKEKFGEQPDLDLLTKITKDLGPAVYNNDASKVAGSDEKELEIVKKNYLIKKLGLNDDPKLMEAIHSVMEKYGPSNRIKYRAVIYYMLCKHFNKASAY